MKEISNLIPIGIHCNLPKCCLSSFFASGACGCGSDEHANDDRRLHLHLVFYLCPQPPLSRSFQVSLVASLRPRLSC